MFKLSDISKSLSSVLREWWWPRWTFSINLVNTIMMSSDQMGVERWRLGAERWAAVIIVRLECHASRASLARWQGLPWPYHQALASTYILSFLWGINIYMFNFPVGRLYYIGVWRQSLMYQCQCRNRVRVIHGSVVPLSTETLACFQVLSDWTVI